MVRDFYYPIFLSSFVFEDMTDAFNEGKKKKKEKRNIASRTQIFSLKIQTTFCFGLKDKHGFRTSPRSCYLGTILSRLYEFCFHSSQLLESLLFHSVFRLTCYCPRFSKNLLLPKILSCFHIHI